MGTKAKTSAVASSLHTQVCSHLHVRDANRCEDTQRCNGPEPSTQGLCSPADSSLIVGHCRLPRCRTRSHIVLCLQSPSD